MRSIPKFIVAWFFAISFVCDSGLALAESFFDQFLDPKDGKLDASQWLSGRSGFLPIPLIISDPAVGYGAGLAVAFFHESEVEARWDVTPRWSLVGFVGSGWTADSIGELGGESGIVAGGGGFRYLLARRYGLRVGLDVARGPDDTVVYMAVGSNWN